MAFKAFNNCIGPDNLVQMLLILVAYLHMHIMNLLVPSII